MSCAPLQKRGVSAINFILERLEHKGCPQGLNVMLEELLWMGAENVTLKTLLNAVQIELRKPSPRIRMVSEGVYWFVDRNIPVGWSLFGDRRMLPCFYRVYPPAISWDDLDQPENILPPPSA